MGTRAHFQCNIKSIFPRYRNFHYEEKMVVRTCAIFCKLENSDWCNLCLFYVDLVPSPGDQICVYTFYNQSYCGCWLSVSKRIQFDFTVRFIFNLRTMADSRLAPSQWETSLQSNAVSLARQKPRISPENCINCMGLKYCQMTVAVHWLFLFSRITCEYNVYCQFSLVASHGASPKRAGDQDWMEWYMVSGIGWTYWGLNKMDNILKALKYNWNVFLRFLIDDKSTLVEVMAWDHQGLLLLTWFEFNPSMDM